MLRRAGKGISFSAGWVRWDLMRLWTRWSWIAWWTGHWPWPELAIVQGQCHERIAAAASKSNRIHYWMKMSRWAAVMQWER